MCLPGFTKARGPKFSHFLLKLPTSTISEQQHPFLGIFLTDGEEQCDSNYVMRQSHNHDNKPHVTGNILTRQSTQTQASPAQASSCLP